MNQDEQKLAELIAVTARKSDAAHWPEAVAIAMGPVILAAQAKALREAADGWQTRIEAMDWGTTAPTAWLRTRADNLTT